MNIVVDVSLIFGLVLGGFAADYCYRCTIGADIQKTLQYGLRMLSISVLMAGIIVAMKL